MHGPGRAPRRRVRVASAHPRPGAGGQQGREQGRARRRDDRGAAALEFALVSVPVLVLLMGVISYGYMLSFRQALSQGAAEGARAAAVSFSKVEADRLAAARAAVTEAVASYGLSCVGSSLQDGSRAVGTCVVTIAACPTAPTARCVTVALNHRYDANPLTPDFPGIPLPDDLRYTASARVS